MEESLILENVKYGTIFSSKYLKTVKELNEIALPVQYANRFYNTLLRDPTFTELVLSDDEVVGAICCIPSDDGLYIASLVVLATYRNLGIGTKLVHSILNKAEEKGIKRVYLHVHTTNEEAIRFYKRLKFKIEDKVDNYYHRLSPPDAYLLVH